MFSPQVNSFDCAAMAASVNLSPLATLVLRASLILMRLSLSGQRDRFLSVSTTRTSFRISASLRQPSSSTRTVKTTCGEDRPSTSTETIPTEIVPPAPDVSSYRDLSDYELRTGSHEGESEPYLSLGIEARFQPDPHPRPDPTGANDNIP